MSAAITYDSVRESFVIEGAVEKEQFRLIVPDALMDDELGSDSDEAARRAWIDANLPQILSAYTARTDGGWVKAPWNRILVEEIT